MKTKQWLILLASCLMLAAAPLTGCGGDEDPSTNNGSNNGGDNNGTPDADNNGTPDAGNNGTADSGDQDTGEQDTGDQDTGTPGACDPNLTFTGQAYAQGEDPHNGGNPVEASTVTLDDAGLQAVYDAVPETSDDQDTEDVNEGQADLDPGLQVSGATVIATASDNPNTADVDEASGRFYIVDQNSALEFFYAHPEGEEPTEPIKVGDKVSFTVTQVENYGGKPEITAVTGFTVDSSDNDVPYHPLTGQAISADLFGQLVQVGGEVTAIENDSCGGSNVCYTLTHGENADQTVTLRSSSNFVEVGDCVTYFGPLGAFPGPLGDSPSAQLDTINFDWLFDPPSE